VVSTLSAAVCIFGSIYTAFVALNYASKVPHHFLDTGEGEGGGLFWKALLFMSLGLGLSFFAGYVSGAFT
jgi:hypothetical protein